MGFRHPGDAIANIDEERARRRGQTFRRLIGELAGYRRQIVVLFVLTILTAAAQSVGPWLIGRAIDAAVVDADIARLSASIGLLLASYIVNLLAGRGQFILLSNVGQRVVSSFRGRIFAKVMTLPLGYFDKRAAGDLQSRLVNDVDTLNQLLGPGLAQVFGSLFGLIGIGIAMALLDWRLALASAVVIPVMIVTTKVFSDRARRAYRETRTAVSAVSAQLEQDIVGIREAQAFNRTEVNIARFRERNAANRDANVAAVGVTSAFTPAIDVLSTLGSAIVIGVGGYLALTGGIAVGVVAAFLLYVQQFFRPIQVLSQLNAQMQAALAGGERIYELLDSDDQPADAKDAVAIGRATGDIVFDDVTFAYDSGRPVLRQVSFHAEPGQTIALVGPTGAGKTTIASLIPRFYDVTEGSVRIDGHDVRSLERAALRANIGIVLQEPFLFGRSVAENIAYGRPDSPRDAIEAAARAVHADDFIQALPRGYDTILSENGGSLSQGQRQLLGFARAVLADPAILILDEATSRIDTRTEALIQSGLARLLAGRTSIVVAHRLSTIENADQILVIDAGRIVERGTHAALLAAGTLYAGLHRRQFRDEPVSVAA